jgi:hypothetical protein
MPVAVFYACCRNRTANIVLEHPHERVFADGKYAELPMGCTFIARGENVALIGELVGVLACSRSSGAACAVIYPLTHTQTNHTTRKLTPVYILFVVSCCGPNHIPGTQDKKREHQSPLRRGDPTSMEKADQQRRAEVREKEKLLRKSYKRRGVLAETDDFLE